MVRATFYSTGGPPNLIPQKPLLCTKINAAVKAGTIIRRIPLLSMCVATLSLKKKAAILYTLPLLQPVRRIRSQAKPPNIEKAQSTLALLPLIGYYFDNASFLYFVSSVIEASSGGLLFGLLSYVVVTVNIVER